MAISIDWESKVISVPKADMLLVQSSPIEIRQLDVDNFRLVLRELEDDADGMAFPHTHNHVAPISVGGVALARVVQIINGYTITFEDGAYAVNISGGNSNIGDVINLNSVSVRSANSAGLAYFEAIQQQSFFDGEVDVDIDGGTAGTQYPAGTSGLPVNNIPDAVAIAAKYGYDRFHIRGSATVTSGYDLTSTSWRGMDRVHSALTFDGTHTGDHIVLRELSLSGDLNEHCFIAQCRCNNLSGVSGSVYDSTIQGTFKAHATVGATLLLANCHSGDSAGSYTTFDHNNGPANVNIRNWHGNLKISNLTQAKSISIDVSSGNIEIDSSCTAGAVYVRGLANVIDNSGVGCTVDTTGLAPDASAIADAVWNADLVNYVTSGTMGERLAAEIAMVADVYAIQGLDISNPMTVTQTTRTAGSISLAITGDGVTTSTVTRQ